MSQYGTVYRMNWAVQQSDVTVSVTISDTEHIISDVEEQTIYDLAPTGNPLIIKTINNSNEKFGIFSKQAKLQFYANQNHNAYTFADSKDNRWLVEIRTDEPEVIFIGFLVTTEMGRPFLATPQAVNLVASDNLGLLSEKKLTTDTGETPTGKNRIADYLSWCLIKTGLSLDIYVANNIKPGSGSLTNATVFSQPGNYFVTNSLLTRFFYPGQSLNISGTVSNNGNFVVQSVDNSGLITQVTLTTAIATSEGPVTATFTDNTTGHIYDKIYLDAKTFESEIGECEDCRTVLDKILDKDCFLFQYRNTWHIMRPDDFDTNPVYRALFNSDGTYMTTGTAETFEKSIGAGEDHYWINAVQSVQYERPYKFSKHTYRYETPAEIPCNVDLERGDYDSDIDSDSKKYELDCWDKHRESFGGGDGSPTADIYIQRNFVNGYENERFLVFEGSEGNFVKSEEIPVTAKDKINVGVTRRMSADISGSGSYRDIGLQVRLYANDGTFYVLEGETSAGGELGWRSTNASFNSPTHFFYFEGDASDDLTEPVSLYGNTESPPIPKDGMIRLCVHQSHMTTGDWPGKDTYIDSVTFDYIAWINSSYQKYSGQHSKVERSEDGYSANIDEDVSISDSPKPLLKGTMFFLRGTTYVICPHYYNSTPFALGNPPSSDWFHPYEYIRVFSTFNQYRRGIRFFEGDVNKLEWNWPDMIHKFTLTDADPDSDDRKFMIVAMEQNWRTGIGRYTFAETFHADGKVYDDPFEFKYLTE